MISDIIREFCQQYGLSGLSLDERGSLSLSIEDIGDFQLVQKSPKFLTGLHRKVENLYLLDGRKILSHSHFREAHLKPLHVQLHNDTIGLYYIFEEREIDVTVLSRALDSLTDTMDKLFQSL